MTSQQKPEVKTKSERLPLLVSCWLFFFGSHADRNLADENLTLHYRSWRNWLRR